jgi:endonuclease G
LDATPPSVKAIGLIMPNEPTKRPIYTYAMSVAEVEARTGLDFFPALPDSVERIIESTLRIEDWSW